VVPVPAEPVAADPTARRVLPRPLRKPARILTRYLVRFEWKMPERIGLKAGIGLFAATAVAGMMLGGHLIAAVSTVTAAAGLAIDQVTITGQSETSEVEVLDALQIGPNSSLLTLNVAAARRRVEDIPWVESAEIRKYYPGSLQVALTERSAFALWQRRGSLAIIDRDGNVLSRVVSPRYAAMLQLVGPGANERATELTDLIGRFPELEPRVRAAVLVSERRWNLMLRDGTELLLPTENPEAALRRLMAIDATSALLAGDITRVDLRFSDRLIVGLTEAARAERLKAIEAARKLAAKQGLKI
jgi:cell division protein FtsQ